MSVPKKLLDDATLVPIRWVFLSLGLSGGALGLALAVGVWSARISLGQEAADKGIAENKTSYKELSTKVQGTEVQLGRIEGKLDLLLQNQK